MKINNWNSELYDGKHAFVSKYGEDVVRLLEPRHGERILDLGCGTGDLTAMIAESGADVIGLDPSETMLEKARVKYPGIRFVCGKAEELAFDGEFDAVFSNAVMHWIPDQRKVAEHVRRALKPGGRFVLEFGGAHCNEKILGALREEISKRGFTPVPVFYFRSMGEYAVILEKAGFTVDYALQFPRDTILEGEDGMMNFLNMFPVNMLAEVPRELHLEIFEATVARLRKISFINGQWHADYVRLRVKAHRQN